MTKEELIALAKELAETDDLKSRAKDVAILKKESRKILNRDEDNLAEKEKNEEFAKYYDMIASREGSLLSSIYEEKKSLVNKAKALLNETNIKKATNEMNDIFNEFKSLGRCTKEQDDELWAEMKETRDAFSKKRQEFYDNFKNACENSKKAKESLVAEMKKVLEIEDFKEASNKINVLLEDWKKAGFAGKEVDDALWAEFNGARQEFFAKRKAYYDSMQQTFDERAAKKEELIKKAKVVLANSEFTKEEVETLKSLREEWKKVGFAGKGKDDELWNTFNGVVNKYFESMRSYR